jgi:hypothetical protein
MTQAQEYWQSLLQEEKNEYKKSQLKKHFHQVSTDYMEKRKLVGAFEDMPNEQYHSGLGYSASQLKKGLKATSKFFDLQEEQESNSNFEYGNLTELMLLEEERFNQMYLDGKIGVYSEGNRPEQDKTMASKINTQWKVDFFNDHEITVSKKDYEEIKKAVDNARSNKQFRLLSKGMLPQQSYFWIDEESELLLKTRPDIVKKVLKGEYFMTDVKTCRDASPNGFARDCANLNYPLQAVTQIDGFEKATGNKVLLYTYMLIEKESGLVQFYELTEQDIEFYRSIYKKLLIRIRKTLENPERLSLGYCDMLDSDENEAQIMQLELPYYAKKELATYFNID